MYIPRSIDQQLLEWKQGNVRKPLLLRGARQVGKSSAVRHLGETFEHYIEVNFEKRPELKELFEKTSDVHQLATRLGILYNVAEQNSKVQAELVKAQAAKNLLELSNVAKQAYLDNEEFGKEYAVLERADIMLSFFQ